MTPPAAAAPLAGRLVVVTRAVEQAGVLSAALEGYGASVLELATIAFAEPADGGAALERALASLSGYAWVVLSSPNAVNRCFARPGTAARLGAAKVAAVGPGTAAALAEHGVRADLVAARSRAEGLAEVFPATSGSDDSGRTSRRVLVLRAAEGRGELPAGLADLGWQVEVVAAYRTVRPAGDPAALARLAGADAVAFASGSAVRGFLELAGRRRLPAVVATIGPVTSEAARAAGIGVTVEAGSPSPQALAAVLASHFAGIRCRHD